MPRFNQKGIISPVAIVLALLVILGGAGYFAYTYGSFNKLTSKLPFISSSSKSIMEEVSRDFSSIETTHVEMDMETKMSQYLQDKTSKETKTTLKGFADIDLQNNSQRFHVVVKGPGQQVESDGVILGGKEMYMKSPLLGNFWLKTEASASAAASGIEDYSKQTEAFLRSLNSDSIVKLNDESVDGVEAYHYRVDISTDKYIEFYKTLGNADLSDQFKQASITTELWIDKQKKRLLKLMSEVKNIKIISGTQDTISSDVLMTMKYSKFNQKLDIQKPEGEILTQEEFVAKMLRTAKP